MTRRTGIEQMPRTVARLVAAGAVALGVLTGTLGSTAAEERLMPTTQAPGVDRPGKGNWYVVGAEETPSILSNSIFSNGDLE